MTIDETRFAVVDVETTGLDPQTDKIVQIAAYQVYRGEITLLYESLVHPLRPIPPEVSAIHHITSNMVKFALPWEAVWPEVAAVLAPANVLVAHNAAYDRSFLPETGKSWLCTKRLAQHLWPDAPNHKNQTLRYWLDIELEAAAHDATGDTLVTSCVLLKEIEAYLQSRGVDSAEALIQLADSPVAIQKMPFGKHFGERLSDVPQDYLRWALRNITDMNSDLRWSVEQVLRQGVGQ